MKCEWSKLDKIETDYEKVNLKNVGPKFFKFQSVQSKQVVNNKIGYEIIYVCCLSEIPPLT